MLFLFIMKQQTKLNDMAVLFCINELWKKAMDILHEMQSKRVWPDKYSYSSAISCCASGARYQEAIDLIKVMRNGPAKIRPNRISYTGAMSK